MVCFGKAKMDIKDMPDYARAGIQVKFLAPTDTKGTRVRARRTDHETGSPQVVEGYDYGLQGDFNNAKYVAGLLAAQLGWVEPDYRWGGAAVVDGGYVFAMVSA